MLKLRSKLHEVVWQFNNLAYTSALMFVWPGHFYFTKLDQRFLSLWARPQPELWTSPDPSLKQRILTFKKMDDFWQQFVQSFSKVNNLLSSPRFRSTRRDEFLALRDPCLGRDPCFVNYRNRCPVLAQIEVQSKTRKFDQRMFSNLLETIVQVAQLIVTPDHWWRHRVFGEAWPRLFGKVLFLIAGFRKHSAAEVAADFGAWIADFVVITATEASRILWLSIKAQGLTASKYKADCMYRRALLHDCIPFHRVYFAHGVIYACDLCWYHISILYLRILSCLLACLHDAFSLWLNCGRCGYLNRDSANKMPQSTKGRSVMRHVNRLFVCSLLLPYIVACGSDGVI